jgi:hypothetical protein
MLARFGFLIFGALLLASCAATGRGDRIGRYLDAVKSDGTDGQVVLMELLGMLEGTDSIRTEGVPLVLRTDGLFWYDYVRSIMPRDAPTSAAPPMSVDAVLDQDPILLLRILHRESFAYSPLEHMVFRLHFVDRRLKYWSRETVLTGL